MKPISILICEDSPEKRGYLHLLQQEPGFTLAGEFRRGEDAIAGAVKYCPDVVIMDIQLSGISGIESTRLIKERRPDTQIIMYTACEEEDILMEALYAGASGYLLKKTPLHRLIDSIYEVMDGGSPMSPRITRKLIRHLYRPVRKAAYPLSARELQVLALLVEGLPIKVIAGKVFLSEDGVKKNLKNIYNKLHVSCGKEAVVKAIRERIV